SGDVVDKCRAYLKLQQDDLYRTMKLQADAWTAAFFMEMVDRRSPAPTTAEVRRLGGGGTDAGQLSDIVNLLAEKFRFFHWHLEFPDVFDKGGFDVVLGTPPWERVKLQDKEFFAYRDPEVAAARTAAERKRMISRLRDTKPDLYNEYIRALRDSELVSKFLHGSGRFPLTGVGDVNTYAVFAELSLSLINNRGRAGLVVPSGIATDFTYSDFFSHLVDKQKLVSLYDFENRVKLFREVDSRMKFSLLTMTGSVCPSADFAFFLHNVRDLLDEERHIQLTRDDMKLLNPNTGTCPIFRNRRDAELTRKLYRASIVLVNERTGENPWGVRFLRMFDMANDSHLFRTAEELESDGFRMVGNRFVKGYDVYLPLYEAKMIWHYDHRYGTYEGAQGRSNTHLPNPGDEEHADAAFLVQPWYWVPAEEVEERLGEWKRGWLMGWRDVTNATNEHTAIFSLVPRCGVGHTMPLIFGPANSMLTCCLLSNVLSLTVEWILRQKIGGTHLTFFILRQLPVLPPTAYTAEDLRFIVPRVLELTYTSWDIKPFADDIWKDADGDLRADLKRQWDGNARETGGHSRDLPDWISAYPDIEADPEKGIPMPPFRWDERRRSQIQAELDAYYARLYGLNRKQLRYILDPKDLTERELEDILDPWEEVADPLDPQGYEARVAASKFPGETFRVLKDKEIKEYGEYRTRRLVLEAWERLGGKEDA
ncbi:MAG: hypothetical protein N3G75_08305, partial [Methanothrix sp.]